MGIEKRLWHGHARYIDGKYSPTPEYRTWRNMINRCYNKRVNSYSRYGGRGVRVCKRWIHSFKNFLNDLGIRPSAKHSIHRIDNNGNYSPENCKWATEEEQVNNRRPCRFFTYNGKTMTLKQWSKHIGINYLTLYYRVVRYGWSFNKAVSTSIYESKFSNKKGLVHAR